MTSLPAISNCTYEQTDTLGSSSSSTVDPSHINTEVTGHATPDASGGYYEPINVITKPKQEVSSRQIYASLQPRAQIQMQTPQEDITASSSQSPTYQSLQENRSKPVYQSLHTYADTRAKRDGEHNI
jgi:hypothetical protein